jgi:hypothetical protein
MIRTHFKNERGNKPKEDSECESKWKILKIKTGTASWERCYMEGRRTMRSSDSVLGGGGEYGGLLVYTQIALAWNSAWVLDPKIYF